MNALLRASLILAAWAMLAATPQVSARDGDTPKAVARPTYREVGNADLVGNIDRPTDTSIRYHTVEIDGVDVFYREAGPRDAPTVVLLHGFPSSSNMFRNLIPALQHRYHVIAPDYPGFGQSEAPDSAQFRYSFERFAEITDALLSRLDARSYALYVMDYGAPVGYRLAIKHPERVTALVVQNGNAYAEGLKEFWDPIKAYWASGSREHREALRAGTTLEFTRSQYTDGVKDGSRIDPTAWTYDQSLLDRPGNAEIQLDLFYDYRTNVELYPRFHQFFRDRQPPTLIVWGNNDKIFPGEGARAYLRDLPQAELHLLDTGHFALEDKGEEIARLMLDFFDRKLMHK
jgi:pimeloyl-ACP methyl ester carboxylesterase